ncbi:sialate O-acetylesterase [Chitinophaga sp. MM2321]|uniref:sialate O-acetylesterase n=1 Tax=Chitinophaga sp. MM2321 TaxID=3137178 RepID=UPI0032D5A132
MRYLCLYIVCFLAAQQAGAQLRLDDFFGSDMVLQREKPLHFRGHGIPGKTVVVRFAGKEGTTTVRPDSLWELDLPAMPANAKGQSLTVSMDTARLQLHNILIGDLWVCAGQSNMEFPLRDDKYAATTLQQATIPGLRLLNKVKQTSTYNVAYQVTDTAVLRPAHYYRGEWAVADSAAARNFSAVGFYFGKELVIATGVPIGLIHVAIGGSPAEAWLRPAAAAGNTQVQRMFTGDWWQNQSLEPWCIQRGHENLDSLVQQGVAVPKDSLGYNHPFKPGFLYEAAIAPLVSFPVKGIIWYQGESNALSDWRVQQHEVLFPILVADWRHQWQQPDLPFYYCQLSSIGTEKGYHSENWPAFRDSQRRLTDSIPHTGMAVTSDVGNRGDVHPKDKKTVGTRLARVALHNTYSKSVAGSGPIPVKAVLRNGTITVTFRSVGRKLMTPAGATLKGFSLDNNISLKAKIKGRQVIIKTNVNAHTLKYGWEPYTDANLYNSEGLPASTFAIAVE